MRLYTSSRLQEHPWCRWREHSRAFQNKTWIRCSDDFQLNTYSGRDDLIKTYEQRCQPLILLSLIRILKKIPQLEFHPVLTPQLQLKVIKNMIMWHFSGPRQSSGLIFSVWSRLVCSPLWGQLCLTTAEFHLRTFLSHVNTADYTVTSEFVFPAHR